MIKENIDIVKNNIIKSANKAGRDCTILMLSDKLSEDGKFYYDQCIECNIKVVTDIEKYSDTEADIDVIELNKEIVISVDEIEFMKKDIINNNPKNFLNDFIFSFPSFLKKFLHLIFYASYYINANAFKYCEKKDNIANIIQK